MNKALVKIKSVFDNESKAFKYSYYICYTLIWYILSCFLFYNQAYLGIDLQYHINSAMNNEGYSLSKHFLRTVYMLDGSLVHVALAVSFVYVATFFCIAYLLYVLLNGEVTHASGNEKYSFFKCFLISSPLCFLCSIYLPYIHEYFYMESYVTQPLHNITYLLMRLFGLLAVALYVKIRNSYLTDGIKLKDWLVFTALLFLTNYSKPNFIIFFAPAMLCELIYDFVKTKAKGLKNIVVFGMAVICSLPILVFQYSVLYPEATDKPSGIEITLRNVIEGFTVQRIVSDLVCVLPFVIGVTVLCIVKKKVSRNLIFGWLMFAFSYIEYWFLSETGYRAKHGNFGWGIFLASLLLTVICLERLLRLKGIINKPLFYIMIAVLSEMLICGVVYFFTVMDIVVPLF